MFAVVMCFSLCKRAASAREFSATIEIIAFPLTFPLLHIRRDQWGMDVEVPSH